MAHMKPLPAETTPELQDDFDIFDKILGFVPNSLLTMQRRPKMVKGFGELTKGVMDPEGAVDLGLMDCVECALCDQACPSDIPMADLFADAKWQHQQALDDNVTRARFKARFTAHEDRLAEQAQQADQRRAERLQRSRDASRWT